MREEDEQTRKLGFLRIEKLELHVRGLKLDRFEMKEKVGKSLNRSPRAAISVHIVKVSSMREREREIQKWSDCVSPLLLGCLRA